MDTNPLFRIIVEKPALYFGNRDGYLRDVVAFDIGYATAVECKRCAIPVAFQQYIIDTLAPDDPGTSQWFKLIRERATGEKAEWDLFKTLWRDYEKRAGT
jgi:hypothetical protein